ncbi:IRK-interacting protein-like isoform X1 [Olea europaea var. sylvestris]|uniref:IRK-interacting protein-like isoform X1 n=1 Tax=Olea europaea var. sylvestris TaxID=158386 RepID=UPI000C1CE18F|nr:IRK-interacting protein-like isoform X1 [Olea europaea var. sylvestris]
MASITTPKILQDHKNSGNDDNGYEVISRQDIQAAIAKTVELRTLHAALMQGNSPAKLRLPTVASPVFPNFTAQDYPVFTPTYKDEPLPAYQQIQFEQPNCAESWDKYALELDHGGGFDETILSDYKTTSESLRNELLSDLIDSEQHVCPAEDQISVGGSFANDVTVLTASPGTVYCKTRRKSMGDLKSISSCNKCKPALISIVTEGATKNGKKSNITDSRPSSHSQQRNKGLLHFSRLFPRRKKKNEDENSSLNRTQSDEVSRIVNNLGTISTEALKKELMEANESKDAALIKVEETKTSLRELSQKLEYLETYCEELKNTLRQEKNSHAADNLENHPIRKSVDGDAEKLIMFESFLQIVSESRFSVTQLCKTLLSQITPNLVTNPVQPSQARSNLANEPVLSSVGSPTRSRVDSTTVDNLNLLLQPYKLFLDSKYTRAVQYHLEAIINQSFYQDFENHIFQRNGSPKLLDPQQDRQAQLQSFLALKNLSWNEVLRKGTKCYSEEFSEFCDQKMSCIITKLGWTIPWPEQLLQAFFDAAKCIWLLHLLAFSFNPPLGILRVDENRPFDPHYMEDIFPDKQSLEGPRRVKIMVMPGFYVHDDKVLKCKILCRYKSVSVVNN